MKIKSLTLENFRSYKDPVTIKDLSDVNIFIGPNNAGKSNIIEALRYIRRLVGGSQTRGFTEMVFDGRRKLNIHLTLGFSLTTEERKDNIDELFRDNTHVAPENILESDFLSRLTYDVVLGSKGLVQEEINVSNILDGDLTIIKNSIEKGSWVIESLDLTAGCEKLVNLENIEPTLRGRGRRSPAPGWRVLVPPGISPLPFEYKFLNEIRELTTRWHWFEPIRQATASMTPAEMRLIDSKGSNLVQFLNTLQTNDPDEFVRLKNEILRILPHLQKVLAPLRGGNAVVTIGESGLNSFRDLNNVSFGLHQILILVYGILNVNPNSVALIEEPELHLHAGSQRKLFELIKKEAEQKQFFITTHSSIFTGCSERISTYLVTKRDGATNARKITESSELKLIKNALGHRNTDLFGFECVVFVEGDSEEVAFPIIADSLGYDLVATGICLVNVRGSGKVRKIGEYLRYLKDSGVLAYVIADGDKRVKEKLQDWQKQGLLERGSWTVWELEFEDCFSVEMVAEALNEWLKEDETGLTIATEDLRKRRRKGVSIVKTLEEVLHKKNLPSLDKPSLAEKIAHLLGTDIKKKDHKESPPEREIKRIVQLAIQGQVVELAEA